METEMVGEKSLERGEVWCGWVNIWEDKALNIRPKANHRDENMLLSAEAQSIFLDSNMCWKLWEIAWVSTVDKDMSEAFECDYQHRKNCSTME